MNQLITRILSALVAIIFLVVMIYFLGNDGLRILCVIALILGQRELSRILFKEEDPTILKIAFTMGLVGVFCAYAFLPLHAVLILTLISVFFCCLTLVCEKYFVEITDIVSFQAKSLLGFVYVGLLPALAYQIIALPQGNFWFLTLLTSVLFGDTFAYIFGMNFGRNKLSPRISPKKTIEGSLGGLLGSAVAGLISAFYFLEGVPVIYMLVLCLVTGFVAQQGDLFESLLKRVANRKDSGSIMPGHGGILDRIDGILFGVPVIYAGAVWLPAFIAF